MDKFTRIAIIDPEKCKPTKCNQECRRICPVVQIGKQCITVDKTINVPAQISETLCIGCGMCAQKCPYDAIQIVNLPKSLENDKTHRFKNNGFILHRFPIPKPGKIMGLVGANGIGKSTILNILSGQTIPNFGLVKEIAPDLPEVDIEDIFVKNKRANSKNTLDKANEAPSSWSDKFFKDVVQKNKFLKQFKNAETIKFMKLVSENKLVFSVKQQHIDQLLLTDGEVTVSDYLKRFPYDNLQTYLDLLDLAVIMPTSTQKINSLSGGELQRLCIAITCSKPADVYIFDEPTNYLDVKQRMKVALAIHSLLPEETGESAGSTASCYKYVFVVDHDISILNYICDYVCMLYGKAAVYGIVSQPHNIGEGLNQYLEGFITSENMRFRPDGVNFKLRNPYDALSGRISSNYPAMVKTFFTEDKPSLQINISSGTYAHSELIVLLGQNGAGKTTFLKLLAGQLEPDKPKKKIKKEKVVKEITLEKVVEGVEGGEGAEEEEEEGEEVEEDIPKALSKLVISFKQQRLNLAKDIPKGTEVTVEQFLVKRIGMTYYDSAFKHEVLNSLDIDNIKDNLITKLSGGEMQKVALSLCLGNTDAQIYLIDEPSAFLDVEQRINVSKLLRRYIYQNNKTAFIVEHDILMASYLADKVIVFQRNEGMTVVFKPETPEVGLQLFLQELDITMRRDDDNGRPRINKPNSQKDREQKKSGHYLT